MEELSIRIGEGIRELRKAKELSQEELADQASMHYTYIGKVERGEKNLSLESLVKITKVLDISLGEFFNLVDPKIVADSDVLSQLIDLLKDRSLEEQSKYFEIIKTFTELLDRK